ncbi:MAG: ribonuclease domain-containing protein [Thermomonas sp.]|uniref:ribonuclease domain-containing protein n=1 Tax=Thermomonas sp. TaxID=1971895 RepID=UPI0039E657FC
MRQRELIPWLLVIILAAAVWWLWPKPAAQPSVSMPAPQASGAPASTHASEPLAGVETPAVEAETPSPNATLPAFLPKEAHATIALIQRGGPYPHRQDGSTFGNREGHLPRKPRGWYREFTVETPGLRHRGARRIITGGDPPREWYYTDDHYDSFRRFDLQGGMQ